ncbi:unnamed protein product [Leuciscus chuanchicus]
MVGTNSLTLEFCLKGISLFLSSSHYITPYPNQFVLQERKPPNQGDVKNKLHPAAVRLLEVAIRRNKSDAVCSWSCVREALRETHNSEADLGMYQLLKPYLTQYLHTLAYKSRKFPGR